MKRALLGACILMSGSAIAQTNVTGLYVDSLTSEGIPFATVALYEKGQEKPEQVMLTDVDGSFALTTKKNSSYNLSVTFTGNKPVSVPVEAKGKKVSLGNLLAVAVSENIEGVTVVAHRPLIRTEVDRLAYDVEADPNAPAKSVLDMLRKTPLVTVDAQENISVNGSSDFKIYVNDRKTGMFDNNPSKVLKGMPAQAVKSIEVITSPGAKYDAEGVGGIINLVMSSSTKLGGVTATVHAMWRIGKAEEAGYNLTAQKGDLTLSSHGNFYHEKSEADLQYEMLDKPLSVRNGNTVEATMTPNQRNGYNYLELSYEIDTMNLLTGSVNFYQGKYDEIVSGGLVDVWRNDTVMENMYNTNNAIYRWSGLGFDAAYEHKFDKRNIITLSGHYSFSPNSGSDVENSFRQYKNRPIGSKTRNLYGTTDENSLEAIGQVDYSNAINDNNKIEAGLKYTYRNNGADGHSDYSDPNTGDFLLTEVSELEQKQNIFAAYASYNFKVGNFGAKAGMRFETAKLNVESMQNGTVQNFNYKSSDFVPSVFLNYNFTPTNSLNFGYIMRIMRPNTEQLNPHEFEQVVGMLRHGNPDLESEKHHRLSLQYFHTAQRFYLNIWTAYLFCDNSIENYGFNDKNKTIHFTYGNVGKQQRVMLNLYGNITFSQYTSMWINGRAEYVNIYAPSVNERAEGFTGRVYCGLNQRLPWKMNGEAFFGCNGKQIKLQEEVERMVFYSFSLNRAFFDERLNVGLQAANPFNKTTKFERNQWTEQNDIHTGIDFNFRSFEVRVSYRIGDLKAQVRKASSSIDNSDYQQGGNKGGSTGMGQ